MAKKKMNRAEKFNNKIDMLKQQINEIFENRGYGRSKLLILDIIELIMDCEDKAEDKLLEKIKKKLLK